MADPTTVDRLLPGDHVCWTFDDHERHLRALVRFLRKGLEHHQKVLYFTDTFLPTAFLAAAQAYGAEVRQPLSAGQLHVTTAEESFLSSGSFEPERALKGWTAAIDQARAEGYAGLRVAADMGWTVRPLVDMDELAWYEAQANQIFSAGYAMALCCYDRRLFTHAELERVSAAHPGAARAGAGSAEEWEPLLRIRRTSNGLSLEGAADRTNRDALAAVLGPLVAAADDGPEPVVIDVASLTFADVATARLLAGAIAAGRGRILLRGARPALTELLAVIDSIKAPRSAPDRLPAVEGTPA
ncbi:MEDS domain-containing protein [Nonomuraea muscovyensis]|uniref:Anti-anti-sigma regulatory factor n=1 Tax=Nonomuraea muscovyensis TaxID=1124761 RepID=A0A7X0C554_9ACTN|nr:MEDS domain-containing protein [Nonomuraea muscovyensis]MBB6348717.1 anti-anti-sigma regulatory factor [Nonomuraea muscovyensis]